MKGRLLLSAALALLCWAIPLLAEPAPGLTPYRVHLVLYPGDDGAAVAKRLAAIYRGTLETPVDAEGGFIIALSPAGADLMERDPAVGRLAVAKTSAASALVPETTGVATPWKLGNYEYDGSGNIRRIGSEFFVYDTRNRLVVSADASAIPVVHKQTYTYDNFANLTAITTAGAGQTTLAVDTGSNQVTTVSGGLAPASLVYDAVGNLTRYGTATYTYDALNMLTRSSIDGVTRHYVYSATDERIGTVEVSGAFTRSEWTIRDAGGQVLRRVSRERDGSWKWQEDYIYRGTQMLAAEVPDSSKTRHFHLDHLGTPRLITGNGGAELSRHNYHPFGVEIEPTSTSATAPTREKKQFTGHERDAESLDYMHARFYAPFMGRFLSVDTGRADLKKPQSFNRYAYTMNSPINNTDPDGRETNPVTGQSYILDSQILNSKNNPRKGFFGMVRRNADGTRKKHGGNDIAAPRGTPVFAPVTGTVVQSGWAGGDGGHVLRIRRADDENGKAVYVHISHLNAPPTVKVGDKVVEGQPNVAEVGNTGNAKHEDPHAHTAVMVGGQEKDDQVDPQQWFRDHPSTVQSDKATNPCEPNKRC